MQSFSLEDWRRWRDEGFNRLPVAFVQRDAALPSTWEHVATGPATVLLESAQAGRYSYICGAPKRVIVGQADRAEIRSADCARVIDVRSGRPLEVLSAVLKECNVPKLPNWPPMTGGLMGVLGYDSV